MITISQLRKGLMTLGMAFLLFAGSIFINDISKPALANSFTQTAKSSEAENPGYSGFYRNLQEGKQAHKGGTEALDTSASAAETMEAKRHYFENSKNNSQVNQRPAKETIDDNSNVMQKVADNVREKLNLDEPVPQSTKDFLNDVKQTVDGVVAPITGQ